MSPPKAPITGAAAVAVEDDPKVFILSRELSEVHLLLDNLSADPDTTIEALSMRQPPVGLDEKWIDRICEISWPPPQSNVQKSEQAALLIRTKDYLNRLARPASGMSIAYTLMVTQKDEETQPPAAERKPGVDMDETLWRSSLAEIAFPDLKVRAATFRRWLKRINIFVVAWLIVTCLLSWNVTLGNSALADFAVARARLQAARTVVNDLEAGRTVPPGTIGGAKPDEPEAETNDAAPVPLPVGETQKSEPMVAYCERGTWIEAEGREDKVWQYESADQHQACDERRDAADQLALAATRPSGWVWWWGWLLTFSDEPSDAGAAARIAALLGTGVLPVFYGLLGAAAAVLRALSQKIKTSTLTPRDLSLSLQQLALGAVVGACIGLFIVGGGTTLIGPVTLSGSAISFVAGFGVEAVFQALEALISRIFNLAPAGATRASNTAP